MLTQEHNGLKTIPRIETYDFKEYYLENRQTNTRLPWT